LIKLKKNMNKIISILILSALVVGCSATEKVITSDSTVNKESNEYAKASAMEHFVNGSTAELKGDYANAIIEYFEALNFDTTAGIYYAVAKNYLYLNKLSSALKYSKLSIRLDSTETGYYDLLSDIYYQAHEPDSSVTALEKVLQLDSTNVETYYKLARIYEDNKPLKAVETYENLIKIIGPEWNVLLHVSELYEKLGYYDKASASLEQLMAIDPSNLSLQKLAIDFYDRTKEYANAIRMLDDIIELRPDDFDARERKAQILLKQNKWDEAAGQYEYFLNQKDISLDTKIRIGASYFAKAITDTTLLPFAKKFFTTIDQDTTYWQVKLYLGAIAISQRDDSTAIKNFKYVTENARWKADAWIQLGGLYFDNHRYEEAEKLMTEALEFFPNEFAVNLILGLSKAQQNKYDDAVTYLKTAIDINSSDPTALSAYGFTLNQLNRNEEAIEYLNRALILQPDDVNLMGTLGLIYNSLKKFEQSDSVYEKALKIDPQNALVNNNYAYSLSERDLQLERALEMVKISIKADSLNSSYLDTIGWVYFKLNDYDKAKLYVEKAMDVGGENAVMLEHLGDILYKMGQQTKAKEVWQEALKLDSKNDLLKQKIETGLI
jgi:tetratricopeptide (TPR) repeat protein